MVAWIVLGVVSGSSWGSSRATVLSVWPPHWHARCARALVACVLSDVLPQEEMGCTRFRVALFALASLGLPNLRLKLSHRGVKLSHRGPGPPQLSPGYRMLAPRSPRLASRSATLTTGYPNLASPHVGFKLSQFDYKLPQIVLESPNIPHCAASSQPMFASTYPVVAACFTVGFCVVTPVPQGVHSWSQITPCLAATHPHRGLKPPHVGLNVAVPHLDS